MLVKFKILLFSSALLNSILMLWLIRMYSTIANATYETAVLQKSLLYNYDKLFENLRTSELNSNLYADRVDMPHVIEYLKRHEIIWEPKRWRFDYQAFLNRNNVESISITDWYKRLDAVGEVVQIDSNISFFMKYVYVWYDFFAKIIFNWFGIVLSVDFLIVFSGIVLFLLMILSYLVDPQEYRLDIIERRLYFHERYLEEKLNKGSPIDMPDFWKLHAEGYKDLRGDWKKAYYNLHYNEDTKSFKKRSEN